jgi:cellulose synthase (UDP-forming)
MVLLVLCFVCIERPRKRGAERFASRELAKVKSASGEQIVQLADLSITGARLFGTAPQGLGERIELEFPDCRVGAKIARIQADGFAVAFIHSFETRIAMIRRFYASSYLKPLDHIKILRVAAAVVRRVLD